MVVILVFDWSEPRESVGRRHRLCWLVCNKTWQVVCHLFQCCVFLCLLAIKALSAVLEKSQVAPYIQKRPFRRYCAIDNVSVLCLHSLLFAMMLNMSIQMSTSNKSYFWQLAISLRGAPVNRRPSDGSYFIGGKVLRQPHEKGEENQLKNEFKISRNGFFVKIVVRECLRNL